MEDAEERDIKEKMWTNYYYVFLELHLLMTKQLSQWCGQLRVKDLPKVRTQRLE